MTFNRGMRRLALFLGVLGAIAGVVATYVELQPLSAQRSRRQRFEQLASADVVQQQQKLLGPSQAATWEQPEGYSMPIPPGGINGDPTATRPPNSQSLQVGDPIPKGAVIGQPLTSIAPAAPKDRAQTQSLPRGYALGSAPAPPPGYSANDIVANPFYGPTMNKSGIENVRWAKDGKIESIETTDGALYFPESPPSVWKYLFILMFPVFGFLAPWGFVRSLVWVGAGFFEASKERPGSLGEDRH